MDTLARLLHLLALLQRQPTWTADALAQRLEVTARTVRRDVARLRDLGYMVDAEAGPHGGYRLVGGQALPPLALTDDEAVAATIALRSAAGSGVTGVDEAALTALAKLEQVLPTRLRSRVRAVDTATERLGGAAEATIAPEVLVALAHACRERERVRLAYTDRQGQRTRRDLEPYRLVQANRRWYLVAFDRGRDEWRTLRVDRVEEVQPQGVHAAARPLPDAAALVADAITTAPYAWKAVVRLDAPADRVSGWVAPTVGVVAADGDSTLLRIGADSLEWLAHYLVGLDIPFDVEEPPELRHTLAEVGKRLTASFGEP